LILRLFGNIFAENYQNRFICVRVIAIQSNVIFGDTVYILRRTLLPIYPDTEKAARVYTGVASVKMVLPTCAGSDASGCSSSSSGNNLLSGVDRRHSSCVVATVTLRLSFGQRKLFVLIYLSSSLSLLSDMLAVFGSYGGRYRPRQIRNVYPYLPMSQRNHDQFWGSI